MAGIALLVARFDHQDVLFSVVETAALQRDPDEVSRIAWTEMMFVNCLSRPGAVWRSCL